MLLVAVPSGSKAGMLLDMFLGTARTAHFSNQKTTANPHAKENGHEIWPPTACKTQLVVGCVGLAPSLFSVGLPAPWLIHRL
jgi:hypothetical protein